MSVEKRNAWDFAGIRHVTCIRTTEKEASLTSNILKFMGHPNAPEQKCVIRCLFGSNSEDR